MRARRAARGADRARAEAGAGPVGDEVVGRRADDRDVDAGELGRVLRVRQRREGQQPRVVGLVAEARATARADRSPPHPKDSFRGSYSACDDDGRRRREPAALASPPAPRAEPAPRAPRGGGGERRPGRGAPPAHPRRVQRGPAAAAREPARALGEALTEELADRGDHGGAGGGLDARVVVALLQVRRERSGEVGEVHRLEPDLPRPGEAHQEQPVAAEDLVLQPGHGRQLVGDGPVEQADVARMDAQRLARLELVLRELAAERDPRVARAAEPLQHEAEAAEQARPDLPGVEGGRELAAVGAGEEAAPLNGVGVPGAERHVDDRAGQARREHRHAGRGRGRVLRHEERAAAERALRSVPDPVGAGEGGRRLELDRVRHPAELARLGDDALTRVEAHLEHGHRRPSDLGVHQRRQTA